MKNETKNWVVSDDGRLTLRTKWNSEWQEWVTTYKYDGKLYKENANHTDDKQDAFDTMAATMNQYERSCCKMWNDNITNLKAQDKYLAKDGIHIICIRCIWVDAIHFPDPNVMVEYKWYIKDGMSSGVESNCLEKVLQMLRRV